ncbi:uncharacterized protein BcabD6B2_47970 [Babesia caballi]|uniref:Uncharacterized protein n=1 Tax=Babesia caballi TaxID=5871 RepID=A0AAV4LYQ0_BABCB|nr:hypothetical protein BcabD6B2_47970 [Babesia caballi]
MIGKSAISFSTSLSVSYRFLETFMSSSDRFLANLVGKQVVGNPSVLLRILQQPPHVPPHAQVPQLVVHERRHAPRAAHDSRVRVLQRQEGAPEPVEAQRQEPVDVPRVRVRQSLQLGGDLREEEEEDEPPLRRHLPRVVDYVLVRRAHQYRRKAAHQLLHQRRQLPDPRLRLQVHQRRRHVVQPLPVAHVVHHAERQKRLLHQIRVPRVAQPLLPRHVQLDGVQVQVFASERVVSIFLDRHAHPLQLRRPPPLHPEDTEPSPFGREELLQQQAESASYNSVTPAATPLSILRRFQRATAVQIPSSHHPTLSGGSQHTYRAQHPFFTASMSATHPRRHGATPPCAASVHCSQRCSNSSIFASLCILSLAAAMCSRGKCAAATHPAPTPVPPHARSLSRPL